MKFVIALICLCLAWPATAGSVDKNLLRQHLCAGMDAETARVLADYPNAVRHVMTPEQVARFAASTALEPLSGVLYFENEDYNTYFVIAFRDGCRVLQGAMLKLELHDRLGE